MRQKLVQAMKNGNTLLIRLTDTAPDLLMEYAHDDFFPTKAVFECRCTIEVLSVYIYIYIYIYMYIMYIHT